MGAFQTALMLIETLKERIDIFPNSLGINRSKMPQIESADIPEFLEWLRDQGIKVTYKVKDISTLKPTQRELNRDKVEQMARNAPERSLLKPVIGSNDNYLMDGHHRYATILMKNPTARIGVWQVHLSIRELLRKAADFPKTAYFAA